MGLPGAAPATRLPQRAEPWAGGRHRMKRDASVCTVVVHLCVHVGAVHPGPVPDGASVKLLCDVRRGGRDVRRGADEPDTRSAPEERERAGGRETCASDGVRAGARGSGVRRKGRSPRVREGHQEPLHRGASGDVSGFEGEASCLFFNFCVLIFRLEQFLIDFRDRGKKREREKCQLVILLIHAFTG